MINIPIMFCTLLLYVFLRIIIGYFLKVFVSTQIYVLI